MNIAIIGCGAFGETLAREATAAGHRIAACVEPNRERAKSFAGAYDAAPMKWSAALKSGVDAVAIAAPTPTHAEYIASAAAARLPVVVAAPFCRTAADAKKCAAALRKSGAPAVLAARGPADAAINTVKAQYAHKKVGAAGFVRSVRRSAPPAGAKNWYRDLAQSGGVIFNNLLADCEWLVEVLGDPQRVFAQLVRNEGKDFLEYALVTLTFPSGAIAQLVGSWAQPQGARVTLELCGDAGIVQFDTLDHALDYFPRGGEASQLAHRPGNTWQRIEQPPGFDAFDIAARAIAVAEAALQSAETGKAVAMKQARKSA